TGLQAVRVADLPASGGLDAGDLGALAAHLEYPADPLEPRTQVRVGLEIADLEVDRLAAQAQADLAVVGDHRLQVEEAVDPLTGLADAAQHATDIGHAETFRVVGEQLRPLV